MSHYIYFPVIKTRDAELRAFSHLEEKLMEQILPIYELTKSRKTKITPDGDIHRRMQKIESIQGKMPFVLDLTTDDKYINPQIETLLDETAGFSNWQFFLNNYGHLNIIPMIHLYESEDNQLYEVARFVSEMSQRYKMLAVRLPYDLDSDDIEKYITEIASNLLEDSKLIVFLDADYIRKKAIANFDELAETFINSASDVYRHGGDNIDECVILSTSFPSSPAKEGGEDAEGDFEIYEESLYQKVKEDIDVKYGDYASINTEQIEMKGGTFVPRVDIAQDSSFFYKRYRRDKGSYPLCARKALTDHRYKTLDSWTQSELKLAADNKPSGISPSFWISIRMVYYINSRVDLRSFD